MLTRSFRIAAAAAVLAMPTSAMAAKIRVTMENLAPRGGVWFTQGSVMLHDGNFDTFTEGQAASPELERQAEDALRYQGENGSPYRGLRDLFGEYAATKPGAQYQLFDGPTPVSPAPGVVFNDFAPGDSASFVYDVDANNPNSAYFSFVWMMIASNDAFYGNDDPRAFRLFDDDGSFIGVDLVVMGGDIYDAGTEVNDELRDTTAGLMQMMPNFGTSEGGVVSNHPGFRAPNGIVEDGGVLDDPRYLNANFDVPGYRVARVRVELVEVPEPASIALLGLGVAAIGLRRRKRI